MQHLVFTERHRVTKVTLPETKALHREATASTYGLNVRLFATRCTIFRPSTRVPGHFGRRRAHIKPTDQAHETTFLDTKLSHDNRRLRIFVDSAGAVALRDAPGLPRQRWGAVALWNRRRAGSPSRLAVLSQDTNGLRQSTVQWGKPRHVDERRLPEV
jgi:hypothetical protein